MIFNSFYEEDYNRMKQYYPEFASRVRPLVERACDKMEYRGSRMYDEAPDRNMICNVCEKIFQELEYTPLVPEEEPEYDEDDVFSMSYRKNNNLQAERLVRELIMVMLYSEMYSRRCCRNQCRHIQGCYR